MKLCWDNIDSFKLSKAGNLKKGSTVYLIREHCAKCGCCYAEAAGRNSNFCSHKCVPGTRVGTKHSDTTRQIMSNKAKVRYEDHANNNNYKGGVERKGWPLYITFNPQITNYDDTRAVVFEGLLLLQVKCHYCTKWFIPTINGVRSRLTALKADPTKRSYGEGRFYCSTECKQECPSFNKRLYPKGFKPETSREVQPALRKLVLERDNWTCQKCGSTDSGLHCHHIDPVINNPVESADLTNCITLCKECHKAAHKLPGCGYQELICKEN